MLTQVQPNDTKHMLLSSSGRPPPRRNGPAVLYRQRAVEHIFRKSLKICESVVCAYLESYRQELVTAVRPVACRQAVRKIFTEAQRTVQCHQRCSDSLRRLLSKHEVRSLSLETSFLLRCFAVAAFRLQAASFVSLGKKEDGSGSRGNFLVYHP